MAYAPANSTSPNPPTMMAQSIAAPRQWIYRSTHTAAEAIVAGFITDGLNLGMKVGDPVLIIGSTTFIVTSAAVILTSTTGISLSTGSLYSS